MTIGDRLRQARKDAGMTQAMLARLSGVDQARISGLETGTQEQSVYVVELALALNVDAAWLQTGVAASQINDDNTAIGDDSLLMGDRVKTARNKAGLTQAMLAKISGVDQTRISAIELNKNKKTTCLIALGQAMGVDPAYLETGVSTTEIKARYTVIEKEIISLLRQLTDEQRVREIAYLERLVKDNSKLARS